MNRSVRLALVSALLFSTACDSESKPDADAADAPAATASAATGEAAPAEAAPKGIADPANDAAVVALAKPVLECEWTRNGPKSDCEASKAWNKAEVHKKDNSDPTLINFLEDEKTQVRWLGASKLGRGPWTKDKALAQRVLAAASAESDELNLRKMGRVIGSIDLEATQMGPQVQKLMVEGDNAQLREGLVSQVLFVNRDDQGIYDLMQKLAREEKDPAVRKAAASAFWVGGGSNPEQTCAMWLELVSDADSDLAGNSAYHAAFWSNSGGCQKQWDPLLDKIEELAKAGKVESSMMVSALSYLHGQKNSTDAQKKRAMQIAITVLENEANKRSARSGALRALAERDPALGKKYAEKYKDDKDTFIRGAAERALEPKKK